MLRMLLLGCVLAGLAACATTDDALLPWPGYDSISLTVGPCYGPCPIYDLVISSDGTVRFREGNYQGPRRLKTRNVGVEGYQAVAEALAPYRLPNRLPQCMVSSTDSQEYTIVWTSPSGGSETLPHYGGDTCPESEKLTLVIQTIPALAGVSDWLRDAQNSAESQWYGRGQ